MSTDRMILLLNEMCSTAHAKSEEALIDYYKNPDDEQFETLSNMADSFFDAVSEALATLENIRDLGIKKPSDPCPIGRL